VAAGTEKVNLQIVTVQTSRGPIDILYDLQTSGRTLHLKDIVIYPRKEQPIRGVLRELLAARRQIAEYAKELGYNKLRITGHRTLQSSSANPGKKIDLTINLF
jgi:hypothetical protein